MSASNVRPVARSVLAVFLVVAAARPAPAQEGGAAAFDRARDAFRAALRKPSLGERRAAAAALAAVKDPKVAAELLAAIRTSEERELKVRAEIERVGRELRDAWKVVDEQGSKGRPISQGTADPAIKKHADIQKRLDKLDDELRDAEEFTSVLRDGLGSFLASLEPAARAAEILGFGEAVAKARTTEDRLTFLRVLAVTPAVESRDALVELLARSSDPAVRTAAADGLALRGDPAAAPSLGKALVDEAWPVRAAAARALGALPSLEGAPPLVEAMTAADGRTLDEIVQALENLTGVTYFDNATLWKEWWAKEGEALRKLVDDVGAADRDARIAAYGAVASKGVLAGIRKAMQARGLEPERDAAAKADRPLPATSPPSDDAARAAADAETTALATAFASALASRPKLVRERAVAGFVLAPLARAAHVADYARAAAYVGVGAAIKDPDLKAWLERTALRTVESGTDDGADAAEAARAKERLAAFDALRRGAVVALGGADDPDVVKTFDRLLTERTLNASEGVKVAACAALGKTRRKAAIPVLITALADRGAVVEAAAAALRAATGKDFGTDRTAWTAWWASEGKAGFQEAAASKPTEDGGKDGVDPRTGKPRATTTFYGIATRSKRILYILDVSGSMEAADAEGGKKRIDVAKAELIQSIRSLPEDATFNIVFFNHDHAAWKPKPVLADKAGKAEATKWAEGIKAVGATNIFDALEKGFQIAGRGTQDKRYAVVVDTVFFMSDGQANRGRLVAPAQILAEVVRMNSEQKLKIHAIGVGKEHDAPLMRALANSSGGTYVAR